MKYMGTRQMNDCCAWGALGHNSGPGGGGLFANFNQVGDVVCIMCKAGMATGDFGLQLTLNRKFP